VSFRGGCVAGRAGVLDVLVDAPHRGVHAPVADGACSYPAATAAGGAEREVWVLVWGAVAGG
jgi:hypothetical protein